MHLDKWWQNVNAKGWELSPFHLLVLIPYSHMLEMKSHKITKMVRSGVGGSFFWTLLLALCLWRGSLSGVECGFKGYPILRLLAFHRLVVVSSHNMENKDQFNFFFL